MSLIDRIKAAEEEWRPIRDFPLYEVSNFGKIRSNMNRTIKLLSGYQRKGPSGKCDCLLVNLRKNKKSTLYRMHRLVLDAFVGPCPENMEGCHNDGNPLNNNLENLRWDTHKNNQLDSVIHGTKTNPPLHYGETHPLATMTNSMASLIRSYGPYKRGMPQKIEKTTGVHYKQIYRILKQEIWHAIAN